MHNNDHINNSFKAPLDESSREALLWEYIDGLSQQPSAIEKLVAENNEWKAKYLELLDIHQALQASEVEQPSLRFSKNVMEQIARYQVAPATKEYINKRIIWGIAGFFIITLVGFFIYGFSQVNWSAAGNSNTAFGIDLGGLDFRRMFNNTFVNAFIMLNILLGLLLLDRYLNMKRKSYRAGH